MKKILLILFCIPLIFTSCKEDNNNPDSPFIGYWTGNYTGDESGTWNLTIDASGNCSGEANTEDFETADLTGQVSNNGDFTAAIGSGDYGITFVGVIDSNYVKGTWTSTEVGEGDFEGYNYNQ